jgi:hypothetical protein
LTNIAGTNLSIDSSGNLNASGGGNAAWSDGDTDNLLGPSDGTKTGIEGINEIRTNNSLTVNIDANDDSTTETFTVQQDTDGTATSLLTVNEGGEVDVNTGPLDLNTNNVNNVASIDNGGSAISVDDTLQLGGNKIKAGSSSSDVVIQADDGSNPGNILMGRSNNAIGSSIIGAVISGGGADGNINEVSADYGAVGGGKANVVKSLGSYGTIPGGIFCEVNGMYGFAVGYSCSATANYASALGGEDSHASAANATVAGGKGNTASADYAFVGGGRWNEAGGTTAFAAGAYAHAADSNSFVWNDGSGGSGSSGAFDDQFKSTTTAGSTPTGAETFSVKAKGGVRFITSGDNTSHAWVDTNGNIKASGNVDAQGGTVENSNGALSLSTADGSDLTLDATGLGHIDLGSADTNGDYGIYADGDGNYITLKPDAGDSAGLADFNLNGSELTERGSDMSITSVSSISAHINYDVDGSTNNDDNSTFKVKKKGETEDAVDLFTVNHDGSATLHEGDLTTNSDRRLKTGIEPIQDAVAKLTELEPTTYAWEDGDSDDRQAGVIAQSVERVLPEAVTEGDDGFLRLAYSQLTPLVISAVQDQQDEIEDLEADLDAKDARIEDQHDRIERLESRVDNKDVSLDTLREALDDRDGRIDDLEAENEQLRERNAELEDRLAAVEAELGIDATASQQGVADD